MSDIVDLPANAAASLEGIVAEVLERMWKFVNTYSVNSPCLVSAPDDAQIRRCRENSVDYCDPVPVKTDDFAEFFVKLSQRTVSHIFYVRKSFTDHMRRKSYKQWE